MTDPAPSKMELLERRGERDLVREGKSVLEERRDLLARTMWEQAGRVEGIEKDYELALERARACCRRAFARHGLDDLAQYAPSVTLFPDVQWRTANRFGTPWLEHATPEADSSAHILMPPVQQASIELGHARQAMQELMRLLLDLAEAEGNLIRLTHAFRRTQRRVNALEHIVLPGLEQSIVRIQSSMDEMERDDLIRSSLIKRRQAD